MLFSRLPLSLLTLIFVFAFDTTFAKTDGGDNETMKNGDPVEWVDIFAVDYPIVAYVVDTGHHDKAETTYLVACSSDTHTSSCPFAQPYTLIQGPSTLSFQFTAPMPTPSATLTQSFTLGCSLDSTTSMACSATGLAEDLDSPVTTSQSFSFTGTAAQAFFKEVQVVTKTEDLLTHTPGVSSSSAKATITGSSNSEGGVFFEGKQVASSSASQSATVVGGLVVAEASVSATAKTTSGGLRIRGEGGVFYVGVVVMGVLGLGLL